MDCFPAQALARPALEWLEAFPKTQGLAYVEHGTRCGKPGCRCAGGELHPTRYLRWRDGGRQHRRYVRRDEAEQVRAAVELRRRERARDRTDWQQAARALRRLEALLADTGRGRR